MSRPRFTPPPPRRPAASGPRWLQPKLPERTQRELSLAQHVNVDAIERGDASPALLHEWAEGVLMFSRIAESLRRGEAEMLEQLHLSRDIVERFTSSGRIAFEGAELQLARKGLTVFELLAEACDVDTGMAAATWSALLVERMGTAAALAKEVPQA